MAGPKLSVDMDMYPVQVVAQTLWEATEMVRRGALTNDVMGASYKIADAEFNKHMAIEATRDNSKLKHVFDWQQTGVGPRLWKTFMTGNNSNRIITFSFLPSTRKVPFPEPLKDKLKRKHVFYNKAKVLEDADNVVIRRKKAKALVFLASDGITSEQQGYYRNRNGVAFTKGPISMIAGGGYYKNAFQNAFIAWWSSDLGAGGVTEVLANQLGESFAFQAARVAAAKKRAATYQKTIASKDATPEAKKRAEEMIKAIRSQMSDYGRRRVK